MLNDFPAYLERIGLSGTPTFEELYLAHATKVPFENLDPIRGLPNSLDLSDLERKLVANRRGGYCFEHNLLFREALGHIGDFEIQPLLARVRAGNRPGPRPKTHMLLKVRDDDGALWHVDVGYGSDGLLAPMPFGPGEPHVQHGWTYRIIEDGPELVLQLLENGKFVDLYGFVDEPVYPVDLEVSNWFACTNPRSAWTTKLHCSFQEPGRRWQLSERSGPCLLSTKTPSDRNFEELTFEQVPDYLQEIFHLPRVERVQESWRLVG